MNTNPPDPGQMYLYDNVTPPLLDNSYRWRVSTNVNYQATPAPNPAPPPPPPYDLPEAQAYFNVEGPRFRLDPTEVAGVFPPRNGHGAFNESIPHVVLKRRTLPWERAFDPQEQLIPQVTQDPTLPALDLKATPWMGVLLFEEPECTITPNVAIETALPASVVAGLDPPPGTKVDIVTADVNLVNGLLPSVIEMILLTHARQVSVVDRELNVAGGDGWFSVVMSNRVPEEGKKYVACLVSLEQRVDVVSANPPAVQETGIGVVVPRSPIVKSQKRSFISSRSAASDRLVSTAVGGGLISTTSGGGITTIGNVTIVGNPGISYFQLQTSFILLYSWKFECTPGGTFKELMQALDVSMFGNPNSQGKPKLTDTGHLRIKVADRAGETETAWYRGPFVPFQLTRDPLGPYHSADQARRATPETGAEDISYAAAFECGRLLAASDGRLAQELMRWRREAYKVAVRTDSLSLVGKAMTLVQPLDLRQPVATVIAASATSNLINGLPPVADAYQINAASQSIGMNPASLQAAWNLKSPQEAAAILGGDPGTLGAGVEPPVQTPRPNTSLEQVAADAAGLSRLSNSRDRLISNTTSQLEAK
jgi:hypothetical protein